MKKDMQGVPKLRFKGFADAWEQRKLGEFGSVAMNKRIFKAQTTESGDIPFYKIGTFGGTPDAYISRKLYVEYKNKYPYPKKGDILISASGSIGRTVVYAGEEAYYQDSNIVWLNHDSRLDNSFLLHVYAIVKWAGIEGSTISRLYNENILSTSIKLPKIEEQRKIGDLLSKIDTLITLHQRKLSKLQDLKKALLVKMFPAEGENVPAVRFKGYEDAWEQHTVGELCQISTGKSNTQDACSDGTYPFYVRSPIVERSSRFLYDEEAVLTVGDGVGTGKVFHYVNGKYDLHQRVYRIYDFQNELDGKFFYYLFSRDFYNRIMMMSAKTSVDSVRYEMIADMAIKIPDINEQRVIAATLNSIDTSIVIHQRKLSKLKDIKKALLNNMFPGGDI